MQTVLGLGRKGAELLSQESGQDISSIPYFTPARFKRSMFTLEHELAITQVALCLDKLEQNIDDFKLLHWETSRQRIGTSVRVITGKGLDNIPLVADAFFGIGHRKQSSWFLLEVDRGTIDLVRMRKKLRGYLEWWRIQGPQHRFGLKNLRILFLVPNEKRLLKLKSAWRSVCERGGKGFIWFGLQGMADFEKETKILDREWHRIDRQEPQHLLHHRPGS